MSKNLTRKGLAFGAIVALGASLLNAAPAFAADELTLAPSAGTLYKTIEGEKFTLLAGLAPATSASNVVQLKYQIVTTATLGTVQTTSTGAGAATTTAVAATQPTNTFVYAPAAQPTVGSSQTISLTISSAIASGTPATAAVTAFFDANSNDVLDAGEYTSSARTITWVDAADVTSTVTLTAPSEGDTSIKANVALTGINQEQVSNNRLAFLVTAANGTSTVGGLTLPSVTAGTPNVYAAGTAFVSPAALASGTYAISPTTTGLASTGGVKVSVRYLATATGAASFVDTATAGNGAATIAALLGTEIGTATAAVTARTIGFVTPFVDASANSLSISADRATNGNNGSAATLSANVRLNSAFTLGAVVQKLASPYDALASVPVTAKIEVKTSADAAITLTSSKTLSVNGTVYNGTTALPTALALTSDADGKVTVNLVPVGLAATDYVKVTFTSQGFVAAVRGTQVAPTYSLVEDKALTAAANRSVIKGSSVALAYTLVDQFKQVPSTGNYRLKATATTGAGVTGGDTYVAFASGKASVSYTTSATGSFSVTPNVELQNTTTGNWGNPTQGALAGTAATVVAIAAQTDSATATVTYNASQTAADVASAAEKAVDTRVSYTAGATYTAAETAVVSGAITQDVTGVARPGAYVTISGAGLLFKPTGVSVWSADSVSFFSADTTGNYSVDVISNIAGSFTVTVAAGNATKTATVKFATAAANASAIAWSTLPAQAQAGRAVDLAAVVTDKWGNVVSGASVNFTNSGVGYVQSTANVTTDAAGKATGRLIVLQNDLGTSYLSATLDIATDVVVAKSVEFGLTDVDVVAGGHRVFVNAEFAKGRTVTVTIDGKRVYSKVQTTDNAVELAFTQKKKGSHTVTVRISGGIVATEKVTTN